MLYVEMYWVFIECEIRVRQNFIQTVTDPHSPWQNPAELSIGVIRCKARKLMQETTTPIRLWDYAYEYVCQLRTLTVSDLYELKDRTPFELVHGYSPDISEFTNFTWFEWIWYYDPDTLQKQKLG